MLSQEMGERKEKTHKAHPRTQGLAGHVGLKKGRAKGDPTEPLHP